MGAQARRRGAGDELRARDGPLTPHRRAWPRLAEARAAFKAEMERAGAVEVWRGLSRRIGVVLPGGGARGAYEAGALMAFQDAQLPTHIISATSIGGINAASYAACSPSEVGNAETLVQSWFDVTPPAVGIDWTRYAWMVVGLLAVPAGLANLVYFELSESGIGIHLHHPALMWLTLLLAGAALLLLHDVLPYMYHLAWAALQRRPRQHNRRKLLLSLAANLMVGGFVTVLLESLHFHTDFDDLVRLHPVAVALVILGLLGLLAARVPLLHFLGRQLEELLRSAASPGLFTNYQRTAFLRPRIPAAGLAASPIRVLLTATDLESGEAKYFSNRPPEELKADPGADPDFISREVVTAKDIVLAVIASSALPIAYEPIALEGRTWSDGGIVANQPVRPALRLGADVLFVVMMDQSSTRTPRLDTFIDVGRRALDILMMQNLVADLRMLDNVNSMCERAARDLGVRPEEVTMEFGKRRYRYVRSFSIRPSAPLQGSILDFGGLSTGEMIAQGYRDGGTEIAKFLAYARELPGARRPLAVRVTAAPAGPA